MASAMPLTAGTKRRRVQQPFANDSDDDDFVIIQENSQNVYGEGMNQTPPAAVPSGSQQPQQGETDATNNEQRLVFIPREEEEIPSLKEMKETKVTAFSTVSHNLS